MGLVFFTFLPVGAFVEPNEEATQEVSRGARARMFAAGVTANTVLTGPRLRAAFRSGRRRHRAGARLRRWRGDPESPAAAADIAHGDRLVAVAGTPVDTADEFEAAIADAGETVSVTADDGDGERTVEVERRLHVIGSAGGNPLGVTIESEPVAITSVNGESVATEQQFLDAVGDAERATVTVDADGAANATIDSETTEIPIGAYALGVQEDGPLHAEGAPLGEPLTIVSIDGERVRNNDELSAVLGEREPGTTAEVVAYDADDERVSYDVELDSHPNRDGGFIGVGVFPGSSGLALDDFGVSEYPAGAYLELLGGDGGEGATNGLALTGLTDSPLGLVFASLILPLGSLFGLPFNFAGFTGEMTNFYVVEGARSPPSAAGRSCSRTSSSGPGGSTSSSRCSTACRRSRSTGPHPSDGRRGGGQPGPDLRPACRGPNDHSLLRARDARRADHDDLRQPDPRGARAALVRRRRSSEPLATFDEWETRFSVGRKRNP